MLDDFFTRALLAGIGVALVAGPLGCFIVWRRLAYFGDALSHGALLGVAMGFILDVNIVIAVFFVSAAIALALLFLDRWLPVGSDALLGLLSHSALALGLVVLSFMTWIRIDLSSLLFGDILSVSVDDLIIIYSGSITVLAILIMIWTPLFAQTVSPDLAKAEGIKGERANLILMLLLACIIAISMKIVGVLLITALLIIPAATARRFAKGPEGMAVIASLLGVLAIVLGLFGSLEFDTPSGPSIVLAALVLFLVSLSPIGALVEKIRASVIREKGEHNV